MNLRAFIFGSAAAVLFFGVACGGGQKCDASSCAAGCCSGDGVCQVGTTTVACGTGGELCTPCSAGQSCSQNVCVESSAGGGTGGGAGGGTGGGSGGIGDGGAAIGDACARPSDCFTNFCVSANDLPGGYCTLDCTANDAVCGAGASCSDFFGNGTNANCMAHCTNGTAGQDTCRPGYVCELYWLADPTQPVCAEACIQNSDCPAQPDGGMSLFTCESGYCCGSSLYKCCTGGPACADGSACGSDGYCP